MKIYDKYNLKNSVEILKVLKFKHGDINEGLYYKNLGQY